MIIQISGHYGDPKAARLFSPLQQKLNYCFNRNICKSYFHELEVLSIVFRISGKIRDFSSEGPEKLKYLKKNNEITIDLVFPETQWVGLDQDTIKLNIQTGIKNCFRIMIGKAEELEKITDVENFYTDLNQSLLEFNDPSRTKK